MRGRVGVSTPILVLESIFQLQLSSITCYLRWAGEKPLGFCQEAQLAWMSLGVHTQNNGKTTVQIRAAAPRTPHTHKIIEKQWFKFNRAAKEITHIIIEVHMAR